MDGLAGKTVLVKVPDMKKIRHFWISWTSEAVLASFYLSAARRLATVLRNCLLLSRLPFLLDLDLRSLAIADLTAAVSRYSFNSFSAHL